MEDLFPLLIFLVIIAVNAIKFFAGKSTPKKPAAQPGGAPPKRPTSSIEAFFERLAEQVEPKQTELPDWPENLDRPDYAQEMEEFEHARIEEPEEEQPAAIVPVTPPAPAPRVRIRAAGTGLRIQGRKNLKQAMLAHIVFSPPRALDPAFKNTLAK